MSTHRAEVPTDPVELARQEVEAIRGEIAILGANDSEFDQLNVIQQDLASGQIAPTEAVRQAVSVRDSKGTYH